MTRYSRRIKAGTLSLGWIGRAATALLAAALFVLLLVFGALAVAVAIASTLTIQAKLWWLSRRRLAGRASGRSSGATLEVEYEVLPPDNNGRDRAEARTPRDDRNDTLSAGP